MSYLQGIENISGLGALNAYTQLQLNHQSDIISRVLAQSKELSGLGDAEGKTLSFAEVVAKYNKGITESEIRAWVWYKRKLGVAMSGWQSFYIKSTGKQLESELFDLVRAGALFYHASELLPFPIYTYGNIYDRLTQLEQDRAEIERLFGVEVYETHLQILEKAKPELLSVTNADPKERPIITAISDFAVDVN
jgi:hypothetical protein